MKVGLGGDMGEGREREREIKEGMVPSDPFN